MSRPKVLFIQHSAASGGAPMSLYYLIRGLGSRIEPVVYFCDHGPAVTFFRKQGTRVEIDHRLGRWPHCTIQNQEILPWKLKFYRDAPFYARQAIKFPISIQAAGEIIQTESPNLIHLNSSVLLHEGIAARMAGIPIVWHLRDFLDHGYFGFRQSVASKIIRLCSTRIISLCQSEADRVGQSPRIRIIPNFVEESFFENSGSAPDLRAANHLNPSAKLIAMLGWSTPDKGAETAIRAMPEILRRVPEAALFLIGTDGGASERRDPTHKALLRRLKVLSAPFPQHLRAIAESLGVGHRVFFPGTFFGIADIIRQLNVVLAPFTAPHFARPILEAGALGIPVVASDIDGPREMVDFGKAGFLTTPGDPTSLAQQTIFALTGAPSPLVNALKERVKTVYSAERNIEATWNVYQEALGAEVADSE